MISDAQEEKAVRTTAAVLPPGYRVLNNADIAALLNDIAGIAQRLGGTPAQWTVRDVADGNLNSVFLVDGPAGSVCVKQSLPWVRVAKDDWPLSVERARYEAAYMQRTEPFAKGLSPALLHFDPALRLIVMESLQPHIILRKALIAGERYPNAARAVAQYAAATLFHTSSIATPFERKTQDLALFSQNHDLQRITVDLVFIDPYTVHPRNRYTTPQLDGWARALREDGVVKAAVARFRNRYLDHAQTLLHGDLHSGSVMVTAQDTRVIDGEFAWVGPIGFDTGMFIANLLMAWYAQAGQNRSATDLVHYRAWIAEQVRTFWLTFKAEFIGHWNAWRGTGDGFPLSHFGSANAALQAEFLDDVWADTVGFAGIEIIRRIIGFSQIADFHQIADPDQRAASQAPALALARRLLREPKAFASVDALVAALAGTEGLAP